MALVRIPAESRTISDPQEVRAFLGSHGIEYERMTDRPIGPDTPGLEAMLNKFNSEHWHDEDEVRFIVDGRGLFHIHPADRPVFAIEVEAGDLIRVPKGTHHWFDLCVDRRIRAIRLFQDPSGWTPHYTGSGADRQFQPVCFGPAYFPARSVRM